jgi:hypothetical protein
MAVHVRAFLIGDIGDGMTALIRYYDPHSIDAVLKIWGEPVPRLFMSPIEQWLYRGRHPDWQHVLNDALTDEVRFCTSVHLRFDQTELDALARRGDEFADWAQARRQNAALPSPSALRISCRAITRR